MSFGPLLLRTHDCPAIDANDEIEPGFKGNLLICVSQDLKAMGTANT